MYLYAFQIKSELSTHQQLDEDSGQNTVGQLFIQLKGKDVGGGDVVCGDTHKTIPLNFPWFNSFSESFG